MSDADKGSKAVRQKINLGDLLTPGSEFLSGSYSLRTSKRDLSEPLAADLIYNLAAVLGCEPAEAAAEFRKGKSALSKLCRALLCGIPDRGSKEWAAYDVVQQVRSENLKGRQAFEEAARRLRETDPSGRVIRSPSPDTVKAYYDMCHAVQSKHERSLAKLFVPEDYRPPPRRKS